MLFYSVGKRQAESSDPYSLPAAGNALYLAGQNTIQDIRPAYFSATNWAYSLLGSYGCGVMLPDYSTFGAWGVAGTGGHNHPAYLGAVLFDYATGQWVLKDQLNGTTPLDQTGSAQDYSSASEDYHEIDDDVPAPGHPYALLTPVSGGVAYITRRAILSSAGGSNSSHKFDLTTQLWSRLTENLSDRDPTDGSTIIVHGDRRYLLTRNAHGIQHIPYLDLTDGAWKQSTSYDWPSSLEGTFSIGGNLIIAHTGTSLRAIDVTDFAGGWVTLTTSDTLPSEGENHWCWHPTRGKFYRVLSSGGNTIGVLTPPSSSPLSNTWTYDTETLGGDTIPAYGDGSAVNTAPNRSLHYVPSLDCLSWMSGNATAISNNRQVTLLSPS